MSITRTAVDVEHVARALREMPMPTGLTACALIMGFDAETEQAVAHVALILAFDEWTPDALNACELANSAAWDALAPLDVVPNLLCRTRPEHEALRGSEPQWLPIADADC
jgi:hypothetical protein